MFDYWREYFKLVAQSFALQIYFDGIMFGMIVVCAMGFITVFLNNVEVEHDHNKWSNDHNCSATEKQ